LVKGVSLIGYSWSQQSSNKKYIIGLDLSMCFHLFPFVPKLSFKPNYAILGTTTFKCSNPISFLFKENCELNLQKIAIISGPVA
jgi:hypothetical protein